MHWICIEKKKTANPHRHTGCPKKSQIRENDLKRKKKSKGNIFEQNREFGKNRENEKKKEKKRNFEKSWKWKNCYEFGKKDYK